MYPRFKCMTSLTLDFSDFDIHVSTFYKLSSATPIELIMLYSSRLCSYGNEYILNWMESFALWIILNNLMHVLCVLDQFWSSKGHFSCYFNIKVNTLKILSLLIFQDKSQYMKTSFVCWSNAVSFSSSWAFSYRIFVIFLSLSKFLEMY